VPLPLTKHLRLRTQLILVTALISFLLCAASLLIVRASVRREVTRQTREAMATSVRAFNRFQHQQDSELLHTSALLSEVPPVKALMTANDPLTVQDASAEFWKLSGTDLLVLANSQGRVLATHSSGSNITVSAAQELLAKSLEKEEQLGWWQSGNNLFRIAIRPITFGAGSRERLQGELVLGRHIDNSVAEQIQHFSGNDVALISSTAVIASTLDPAARDQLAELVKKNSLVGSDPIRQTINNRSYEVAAVAIQTNPSTPIRCLILLPLDSSDSFLERLNWTIVVLGIVIGLLGAAIMMFISRAITSPLETLAGAVRAMAKGDDTHSVFVKGASEVRQLSSAFANMRSQITESQRKQLQAERLAALGRAAGSISHDLRHILAALIANAEFLRDADEIGCDPDEVYAEIQQASTQMTELIDSLNEIARDGQTLTLNKSSLEEIARRATKSIQNNPEFRTRRIYISSAVDTIGSFDAAKLERAIFNLLLNACQATNTVTGTIDINLTGDENWIECSISDNGSGIPDEIRQTLFQPFVSAGKPNGTGLGLTIASKIVHDHRGELLLQPAAGIGTTFIIRVPRSASTLPHHAAPTATAENQSGLAVGN
jgi:signal transduction histidine kinase